jgi:general secretion pathway protein F
MPIFEYQGILQNGKKTKGTLDSDSLRGARSKLKGLGIFPTAIKEGNAPLGKKSDTSGQASSKNSLSGKSFSKQNIESLFVSKRVSIARLAQETRQLSTLVGAGIPIVEALQVLSDQTENGIFKRILIDIREMVEDGSSLARALGNFPQAFPRLYINLVASGEASGQLDSVLENLADHFEAQLELKRKIQNSLFYPIMMFTICILVVIGLVTFVVPTIVEIFQKEGAVLPLPTRIMIGISDAFTMGWPFLIAAIFLTILGLRYAYKQPQGRKKIDRFFLKVPLFGSLYNKIYTARISSTLSTLLASGVELLTALDIIKSLVGNIHVAQAVEDAKDGVREGKSLAKEFERTGLFPQLFCQMVAVGERSGRLEAMLQKAGKSYKNEVSSAITSVTTLVGPIMIVVLGGIVLCIVVSVLMPMFDLMNKIQG